MKNFDDFVKFANSETFQDVLKEVPLNIESKEYVLTCISDISELEHAFNERSLNQFMQILRAYHDWISES